MGTRPLPAMVDEMDWPDDVGNFDARPFWGEATRRGMECPDDLLLERDAQWYHPPVHGCISRQEELKLLERWDDAGRLLLAAPRAADDEDRSEVFSVLKKHLPGGRRRTRQIIHRRRRNWRQLALRGLTQLAPLGPSLAGLRLGHRFAALGSGDDLDGYFHFFAVSRSKARSTPVGRVWKASRLAHLRAHGGRFPPHALLQACFWGLSMGDQDAPEAGQEALRVCCLG